ncbi:response regulator [soil metagenome]
MESPINIILADDDKDDCLLFSEVISELPLDTELAIVHDGIELMHRLSNATIDFPDVLFLDLNMPRKDGFECISEINISDNLKGLPVIIFSTIYDKKIADRLYNHGAYYFMRKPSDFSELKNVLQQALTHIAMTTNSQPTRENFVLTK